jgi:hypothetical protein
MAVSSIIDKIRARAEGQQQAVADLPQELQNKLFAWEAADLKLNAPPWDDETRAECRAYLLEHPDFVPTSVDLASFGSVDALKTRYQAILGRLVTQGRISQRVADESTEMADSGALSIGALLAEGKALKAWSSLPEGVDFLLGSP